MCWNSGHSVIFQRLKTFNSPRGRFEYFPGTVVSCKMRLQPYVFIVKGGCGRIGCEKGGADGRGGGRGCELEGYAR